jgi:hypothetical protein
MTSLPDSARAVLQSPALAHLVTLNPDGGPQVSLVWVGLDGGRDRGGPGQGYRPRPRPMISFMISVVPPKIDCTRLSAQARPTEYSRM